MKICKIYFIELHRVFPHPPHYRSRSAAIASAFPVTKASAWIHERWSQTFDATPTPPRCWSDWLSDFHLWEPSFQWLLEHRHGVLYWNGKEMKGSPKIRCAVWSGHWGLLSTSRFCSVLMNCIHKNPQEIALINNVMDVKEMRLILERVDYRVAIILSKTTILRSCITGSSFSPTCDDCWIRVASFTCGETRDWGGRLQVLVNVSNTCVNTCFWLRHHKPEGAFKNII